MSRTPSPAWVEPADGTRAAEAEPMPPLDAWFHRQQSSGAACTTVGYAAWFDGPPPALAQLRTRVLQRLGGFRRLRAVPFIEAGNWPHWHEDPAFEGDRHVTASGELGPLLSEPLPAGQPPWQLHLLPDADGFAVLLRAHHALLDGQSLSIMLTALLDPAPERRPRSPVSPPSLLPPASLARKLAWALDDLLPKSRPLPFHGQLGAGRDLTFTRLPGELLAAARNALDGPRSSNTAVLLAAVAGALRELGLSGSAACAMVPVDVRTADQSTLLGNHYATVRLPLPAHPDPRLRLAALDHRIRRTDLRQRASLQAQLVASRARRHTAFGAAAGRYVESPRYSSLLCTSLPSASGPCATLGTARLAAAALLPPLGPSHPLAVSLTRHPRGAVLTTLADHTRAALTAPLNAAITDHLRQLATPQR
ncbi:wax ester/triacylglycerol synthase family O-acyltransferase [Kitasatospora sp. RB6PN24]|uniref:wax ester/triacylglycerol synthase family O-acyltransferase n=1 Tax=Kitasatospora humi TaxID=2893891 RepID=UPI001E3D2E18|nr:wax ester/triacylglycerol synthase family O-acyltransferase [Kitasatospora humi]MCC9310293.1 wax ester/triacylglycerol synthase family O-acyltransferase [Kitasatospora humi]